MTYRDNIKYKTIFLFLTILGTLSVNAQSKHFVDIWGGVGYSSLYHGIDNTKVPGGAGYSLGAGYEYNLNRFIFSTGLEFNHLNSKTTLNYHLEQRDFLYPYIPGHYINYLYEVKEYKEKHSVGYINLPLQFGAKFNRYYAIAGVKIGLNLFANYKSSSLTDISATDPMLIDTLINLPSHFMGERRYDGKGKMNLGLNITPGVEFGVYLDEWLGRNMTQLNNRRGTNVSYRVGLFLDYGITNLNKDKADNPFFNEPENNPMDISFSPLSASDLARDKRFGSLFTGVRFTVLFDVGRQNTKSKPKPGQQQQTFPFIAKVMDSETKESLEAGVSLRYTSGNRQIFSQKTDNDGIISYEGLRRGRYTVLADSPGYTDYRKVISHTKPDTLLIALQRISEIYIRVTDALNHEALKATVTVSAQTDDKQLFSKDTDETAGVVYNDLKPGKYNISVTFEGYIYHQQSFDHIRTDTLNIALQPVIKDTRVILHNLFFEFNSAVIKPESQPVIEDLYRFLLDNPEVRIQIAGHTDNIGSDEYNKRLSENRAKAVHDALVKKGIEPERLSWVGKGAADPLESNNTEEGRAVNRRVEFIIL